MDESWKRYLALPAEVYSGGRPPDPNLLRMVQGRFDAVAADPRYRQLAGRPEFQATQQLLRQYAAAQPAASTGSLVLPPPPR